MFGSISFGLASSLVGFIADWTKDMNSIFYVYAVSAVFFIMTAGATTFKPESALPRSRWHSSRARPSNGGATAMVSFVKADSTASAAAHNTDDHTLRRKIQQFHLDPMHDESGNRLADDDDDEEDYSQIRQNEIQRLIQFATESSIIEAVNLSNPPAYRRSSSSYLAEDANDSPSPTPTTLMELLKQRQVFLFFLTMMLMGAALNMVVSFLFIFLTQELGASSSTVGLTGLVGSVTELLFFYYSRDVSSCPTNGCKRIADMYPLLSSFGCLAFDS